MQITYLGHSCFKIKSKDLVLVTDPYSSKIGYALPKTEANIVTITHDHYDHNNLENIEGDPFIIKAPGEYEIKGISVFGISTYHDKEKGAQLGKNTIYTIHAEDLSLCHLGDLGDKLNDSELEEVNGVDILFAPAGGGYTLSQKEIVEVINQIEPKIVIPMHYRLPKLDPQNKLSGPELFLNEIGAGNIAGNDKLIISKTDLPQEMTVISLLKK